MNFIRRFFDRESVQCPRCLGKGVVDADDIKRLKMELVWRPGQCAYCNGSGKVARETLSQIPPDTAYLVNDLPESERALLLSGDAAALLRSREWYAYFNGQVDKIRNMYFLDNLETEAIAESLMDELHMDPSNHESRQEIEEFVKNVLAVSIENSRRNQ